MNRNRSLVVFAALAVLLSVMTPALAVSGPAAPSAELDRFDFQPAEATLVNPNPFKDASEGIFLIRLEDAAVAEYRGGIAGYPATNPKVTGERKLNTAAAAVVAYTEYLGVRHDQFITKMESSLGHAIDVRFEYFSGNNGMAVWLTPEEAAKVARMPGVTFVQPDLVRKITTDAGPTWVGAPAIWEDLGIDGSRGEGTLIGVIDTGINPENPSFAEVGPVDGYVHVNPLGSGNFLGDCGVATTYYPGGFPCNDKLIGAYGFVTGDPTDNDGHGSHTSSTAGGNFVEVFLEGNDGTGFSDTVTISGVAPHANLIMYEGCGESGCDLSALTASIDQAIADGVDVINYSIGADTASALWEDFDSVGFLNAREAGIFVATSAGNAGPGDATLGSPADAPWLISVGNLTHNRTYLNTLTGLTSSGGDLPDIVGRGFTGGFGPAEIVYAGDYPSALTETPELCGVGDIDDFVSPWPAGTFTGQIVVCDRGTFGRVEKGANALFSGAGGYVLANTDAQGEATVADPHHLPGVHIGDADGDVLRAWLANGAGDHMAAISGGVWSLEDVYGDIMAAGSSRGPNQADPSLIGPSISAPGSNILAAHGTNGDIVWDYIGGTSMASPHVAGAGALLMNAHPDWSPAEIQSALMMTADMTVLNHDGATPANWFQMGSGRLDVAAANHAGLVMDEEIDAYWDADPLVGGDVKTLNLASMGNAQCVQECSWTRTFTSTLDTTVGWSALFDGDADLGLSVVPAEFDLAPGASIELAITADVTAAPSDEWLFGTLWLMPEYGEAPAVNGNGMAMPAAHLPIAVVSTTGDLPDSVVITTRRDAGSWPVNGLTALEIEEFTVTINGLAMPDYQFEMLLEDSDHSDMYDDLADGEFFSLFDVPADAARFIAEITDTTSPDLDLFVGFDTNGDNTPSEDEELCRSATGTAFEYCSIDEPAAGTWWVLVQNWAASTEGEADPVTLATAIVTGDEGNMTVEGPFSVPALELFDVRIFFDIGMAEAGDRFYGAFSLGTGPADPGNIGTVPVDLIRLEDDVTKMAYQDVVPRGGAFTYAITIAPNASPEDLEYSIMDVIPEGMTYVEGSATNGAEVIDGVLYWTGVSETPFGAEGTYAMSTSLDNPMCDTGFGGYVNLENFGILAQSGITGDTNTWSTFGGAPISYWEDAYPAFEFSDDGFAIFDTANNYGGSPWNQQFLPDPTVPNNVLAALWQDMEIFYDAAENWGVSLATAGPEVMIAEFDDLRYWGTGPADPHFDFEIVMTRSVDDTPGYYEIVYAYDNLGEFWTVPTIGLEDAAGERAVTFLNQGDPSVLTDGFQVCFDYEGPNFDPIVIEYDVTVDMEAIPGWYANEVIHSNDNPGAVEGVTGYDVYVPTTMEIKDDSMYMLDMMFDDAGTRWQAYRIARALLYIGRSLDPWFWSSEDFLSKYGSRVFVYEKYATYHLLNLGFDLEYNDWEAAFFLVDQLVLADRALAYDQIMAAIADDGKEAEIAAAMNHFALGEAAGDPMEAIDHYRHAWNHAWRALMTGYFDRIRVE